eukprot:19741-Heterococcus_DN1.PRE.2
MSCCDACCCCDYCHRTASPVVDDVVVIVGVVAHTETVLEQLRRKECTYIVHDYSTHNTRTLLLH